MATGRGLDTGSLREPYSTTESGCSVTRARHKKTRRDSVSGALRGRSVPRFLVGWPPARGLDTGSLREPYSTTELTCGLAPRALLDHRADVRARSASPTRPPSWRAGSLREPYSTTELTCGLAPLALLDHRTYVRAGPSSRRPTELSRGLAGRV